MYLQRANVVRNQTINHRKHCKITSIQQADNALLQKLVLHNTFLCVIDQTKPNPNPPMIKANEAQFSTLACDVI